MNKIKSLFLKVLAFMLLLVVGTAHAQTCDPNIEKALKETHVSYYDKVTQGDDATFTSKYRLTGTT